MNHPSLTADKTDRTLNVVILAGGRNTIPLYEGYVPGPKALLSYEGKTSIEYVIDALFAVPDVGEICIEGPKAALEMALANRNTDRRITFVEGGATFLESLVVGLRHFRDERSVLFITADIPLLTPKAIEDFLAGYRLPDALPEQLKEIPSVHVAAVPQRFYTGEYEKFTKPFNRFRDIHLCHGNLFVVDTSLLKKRELRKKVSRLYDGRKSVLSRLAFGWQIALTYLIGVDLLHMLTLRYMVGFASRYLGVRIVPVLIAHPAVTMDVDEAKDYRFVQAQIQQRQTGEKTEDREPLAL